MHLEAREGETFYFGQVMVESISSPCGIVEQYETATHGGRQVRDRDLNVSA